MTHAPAQALLCGTFLSPISVSASALNFGVYSPLSPTPTFANNTVTVSCTVPLDLLPSLTVTLSAGVSGSSSARYMTGAQTLSYNVYTTGGYSTIWGDGAGASGVQSYSSLLLLGSVNFTGYGRMPSGSMVMSGAYSDTLIVTVIY